MWDKLKRYWPCLALVDYLSKSSSCWWELIPNAILEPTACDLCIAKRWIEVTDTDQEGFPLCWSTTRAGRELAAEARMELRMRRRGRNGDDRISRIALYLGKNATDLLRRQRQAVRVQHAVTPDRLRPYQHALATIRSACVGVGADLTTIYPGQEQAIEKQLLAAFDDLEANNTAILRRSLRFELGDVDLLRERLSGLESWFSCACLASLTEVVADRRDGALPSANPSPSPNPRLLGGREARFCKDGGTWSITFADQTVGMPDRLGLAYIQELVRRKGQCVSVQDLARVGGMVVEQDAQQEDLLDIDGEARLMTRFRDLPALIEAARMDDPEEAAQLEDEIHQIEKTVRTATGPANRRRSTGSAGDLVRSRVAHAIRQALADLKKAHPSLHAHLKQSIKYPSGKTPGYLPSADVTWLFL